MYETNLDPVITFGLKIGTYSEKEEEEFQPANWDDRSNTTRYSYILI